mmetsp:Transcript_3082/g.6782  ORF Transcript_3082/g.6782 Transcript_3082/m.6782 type:complete len:1092 (+) Transcript_3082:110-3385(+)
MSDDHQFTNTHDDESDIASFSSEDSQEPYFHVATGKILPAREAWHLLAAEGHSRFISKLSGVSNTSKGKGRGGRSNSSSGVGGGASKSVFRNRLNTGDSTSSGGGGTSIVSGVVKDGDGGSSVVSISTSTAEHQSTTTKATAPTPSIQPSLTEDSQISSTSEIQHTQITQSSIDRALHPNLGTTPNPLSPKNVTSPGAGDSDDEETDPIILRAKAMALAAQNGQQLTPEQLLLIAQPDVQQQKLIEETRKAKELQLQQHQQQQSFIGSGIQQMGADLKKFIESEKEKPVMQWGADLGKFFDEHKGGGGSMKVGMEGASSEGATAANDGVGVGKEQGGESSPRKKMEGFGTDPFANRNSPASAGRRKSLMGGGGGDTPDEKLGSTTPSSAPNDDCKTSSTPGKASLWASMPPLPTLNGSISSILLAKPVAVPADSEPARLSAVLWKRRSGFGKHSTTKAWEKRRVELRGTKLMYYQSPEEEQAARSTAATPRDGAGESEHVASSVTPGNLSQSTNTPNDSVHAPPSLQKRVSLFEQAAQAAEQRIQTAKDELSRMAVAAGIEKPPSADTPRGILDISKERATVAASLGHSGSPTPFCISIKTRGQTTYKFCFDNHSIMMEWLAALTDVVVQSSLDIVNTETGKNWEMENYCLERRSDKRSENGVVDSPVLERKNSSASMLKAAFDDNIASVTGHDATSVGSDQNEWTLSGNNLYAALAMTNTALVLARSSSTSIDRYWMMLVLTNFGIWQLCTRPKVSRRQQAKRLSSSEIGESSTSPKLLFKPIAGKSTIKVATVNEPALNKDGDQFPAWVPMQSSGLEVRSHGYLASKTKISAPADLYECIGTDCFASNARIPDIAPRVVLPDVQFSVGDSPKTWKSPDIMVISVSIPTEAPSFGKSTDDGQGTTMVGYFKMKEETRAILRRITAADYDASTDTADDELDVQKRITNGVRLWERYCKQAPNDPEFQARFKLVPHANLVELGCPAYIAKYNGKPVLIKRNQVTGFFTDYPALNAMEFDISLHPFPYLFKQATSYLKENYFDKAVVTFGFVVEGRCDDELPEVMIGAMRVCYPSPKYIVSGEKFFAGTSKTS